MEHVDLQQKPNRAKLQSVSCSSKMDKPFSSDLKNILSKFKHVLIPEINMGQLIKLIRSEFLVDAKGLNLVRGKPIGAQL